MKKRIIKSTIVLTVVGIVCGLLIGLTNLITDPVIKKNQLAIARKAYESFFPELDDIELTEVDGTTYVYEYVKILKNKEVIGHAFRAKGTNQRGLVDLVIGADATGKLMGVKILSTENTPGFYDLYEEGSNKYLKGVIGNTINDVSGIDNITGATQTGDLLNAILKEVGNVAGNYIDAAPIVLTNYEKLFGIDVTHEEGEEFIGNEIVIKKEDVYNKNGALLGFAYTGTITVENTIPNTETAELTLLVGISLEGTIKGVVTVKSEHTPGLYNGYEAEYLKLIGNDVNDLNVDSIADSTVSGGIINQILEAIKPLALIDVEYQNYRLLFNEYNITVANDDSFIPNDVVTKREIIKDAKGNILGYAYTGTIKDMLLDNSYGEKRGDLTLLVGVDQNLKIVGIAELINTHTGGYYRNYNDALNSLSGKPVDDLGVDSVTGSTKSGEALNEIFKAIKEVINND